VKIGVLGAGAIGCYVGGRLADAGANVVLVGRPRVKEELERAGLVLSDVARSVPTVTVSPEAFGFALDPQALAECEVVLVAVKSAQTAEAGRELARVLRDGAIVVSLQNGIRNADVLRGLVGERLVLGGIVSFNVVSQGAGQFRRATTGPLVIEGSRDPRVASLVGALRRARFDVDIASDIRAVQWAKLVMNLNNAVSALSDVPTPELLFDPGYRRVLAVTMGEALSVLARAKIRPGRLGPLPVRAFPHVLRLPTALLRPIARLQLEMDAEARSSMWEELARGRPTEVEELNGEIVRLARASGTRAPINARVVALVHEAERRGRGSPRMSADALYRAITASSG
jgi:2-dehydropantoate 2-reductase